MMRDVRWLDIRSVEPEKMRTIQISTGRQYLMNSPLRDTPE